MDMIRSADVREDNDDYQSPLDELFNRLEIREPSHIALKYYRNYHSGSAKTLKSVQLTLNVINLREIDKKQIIVSSKSHKKKRNCLKSNLFLFFFILYVV